MKANFYTFAFAFAFFLSSAANASDDPVRDYVRSFSAIGGDRSIYSDDKLLRIDLDLDNDGTKEVLISMARNRNGKAGNIWHIYSRTPSGFKSVDVITFSRTRFYLGDLPNGKHGIASFFPGAAGAGVMWGNIFDGSRVSKVILGEIVWNKQSNTYEGGEIIDGFRGENAMNGDEAITEISADKLAAEYGVSVESKTYRQALKDGLPGSSSAKAAPTSETTLKAVTEGSKPIGATTAIVAASPDKKFTLHAFQSSFSPSSFHEFIDVDRKNKNLPVILVVSHDGSPIWSEIIVLDSQWPFLNAQIHISWSHDSKHALIAFRPSRAEVQLIAISKADDDGKLQSKFISLDAVVEELISSSKITNPRSLSKPWIGGDIEMLKDGTAKLHLIVAKSDLHEVYVFINLASGEVERWEMKK